LAGHAPPSEERPPERSRLRLDLRRADKSVPPRAHYDRRRAAGDRHNAALRNLFNRFLGQLHHCLQERQKYSEDKAFPTPQAAPRETTRPST